MPKQEFDHLFYSAKQAAACGTITVTTPSGDSYKYTEMKRSDNKDDVSVPSSAVGDFEKVAVVPAVSGNRYTHSPQRQKYVSGRRAFVGPKC